MKLSATRLEQSVAVDHGPQHEVVKIGGENDQHAEDGEEHGGERRLLAGGGIEHEGVGHADLKGDHGAGGMERDQHDPADEAEEHADGDLAEQENEQRQRRGRQAGNLGRHHGCHHDRYGERDQQPDARGDIRLAEAWHHHQGGAGAGEHQEYDEELFGDKGEHGALSQAGDAVR